MRKTNMYVMNRYKTSKIFQKEINVITQNLGLINAQQGLTFWNCLLISFWRLLTSLMIQQAFIALFVPVIRKVSSAVTAVTSLIDVPKILVSTFRQGVRMVKADPLIVHLSK
jgi:hypothetical protein